MQTTARPRAMDYFCRAGYRRYRVTSIRHTYLPCCQLEPPHHKQSSTATSELVGRWFRGSPIGGPPHLLQIPNERGDILSGRIKDV
jgi:hypothetical protein